jgi:hypothetical protein
MAQDTHFPVEFLALHKPAGGPTAPGAYLRWFVQPYLGLPGIDPLHPSGRHGRRIADCGFRLFFSAEYDRQPEPSPLDLVPLLPDEQQIRAADLVTKPGWKAILRRGDHQARVDVDLRSQFGDQVCYLRFNYTLCARQTMALHYTIHNRSTGADTPHRVDIHYDPLITRLGRGEQEPLSYAIQVEEDDESIAGFALVSNRSILLGDIKYALAGDLPFYVWSPAGGSGIWTEVPANAQLIQTLNSQLIQPGPYRAMVRALTDFYGRYHGLNPHQVRGNQSVSFEFPDLSATGLAQPPLREYAASQYREICEGGYEPGPGEEHRVYIEPQEAAALASADPAIAYLLGLFRVLSGEGPAQQRCHFKIQGTWPEGQRYCIYCPYDPAEQLVQPPMAQVQVRSQSSTRVVRDYATFRTHHRINVADVSWPETEGGKAGQDVWLGPVAYVIVAESQAQQALACKSPFYVPQEWEIYGQPAEVHYTDWLDYYHATDIHKVLDGTYTYQVAGFDVFGQLSAFQSATAPIQPARLAPSEIQRPEIALSKLPSLDEPGKHERADIPLEVEKPGSKYMLRGHGRDYLSFDYSFFWPLEARYVWDKNRKTGQTAVDYFRLLYLADVPLSSGVLFDALIPQGDGASLKLEGIQAAGSTSQPLNTALFALLQKLGAIDAAGQLLPAVVKAALEGGTLVSQQAWDVVKVTVAPAQAALELELVPASDASREAIKHPAFPVVYYYMINAPKLTGQLFWNPEATFGGSRIGWKYLTPAGVKVRPPAPVVRNERLVSAITTPTAPEALPADLAQRVGVVAAKAVPAHAPPAGTQYGFVIRLDAGDTLAQYDRFFFVPVDPNSTLAPGEYPKGSPPPGTDVEYPSSVQTLFSEDLVLSFFAARSADDPDHPGKVIYRGEALPFRSRHGNDRDELLLFPSVAHRAWQVVAPATVGERSVPLAEFTQAGFGAGNYLTSSITMALEAVVSGQDHEVRTCLQSTTASYKLSLARHLDPPKLQVPGATPPSFGRAAGPPDYHGVSLIRVRSIYDDLDLETKLGQGQKYLLYALPANRVVPQGMGIEYAVDAGSGNTFRRNMAALKTALQAYHPSNPLSQAGLQKLFADFGQRVHATALDKAAFLDLVVELPGESRTVFLYAIKAYDPVARKESAQFTALSRPVYVEDATPPAIPRLRDADLVLREEPLKTGSLPTHQALNVELSVSRQLEEAAPFGYATADDLNKYPDVLGASFPQMVAGYRLYLSTGHDLETLVCPDDSDFAPLAKGSWLGDSAFKADEWQVRLDLVAEDIHPSEGEAGPVRVTAKVRFDPAVELERLPSRLYFCLRAENYLGQVSTLSLSPVSYREIG